MPCHKMCGTNALLIPTGTAFRPQYGAGSFRRHLDIMNALRITPRTVYLPGIATDIDEPSDLAGLEASRRSGPDADRHCFDPRSAKWRRAMAAHLSPRGIEALAAASAGDLPPQAVQALVADCRLSDLTALAEGICVGEYGHGMTYSKKVFIPLTKLCRDVCHYCTFAKAPRHGGPAYLALDDVLAIAEAGRAAGCKEALFTLGDKPELRYGAAREALDALGCETTFDYLERCAEAVLQTDRPAAASQCRRHGRGPGGKAAPRLGFARADAGIALGSGCARKAGRITARRTRRRRSGSRRFEPRAARAFR